MRRAGKIVAWVVGLLIGVPVLLVAAVLVAGNTAPGAKLIASLVPKVTGDEVRLSGLGGRFPDRLQVAHVELRDPDGAYLTIENVALNWHPLALLHRLVAIDRLDAEHATFARLPKSSGSSSSSLPVRIIAREFHIGRLDVAAAVAGPAAALALDGSGELDTLTQGKLQLVAQQLDGTDKYQIDASIDPTAIRLHATANEPGQGLISTLAGLPALGPVAITAVLDGPRSALQTNLQVSAGPLRAAANGNVDVESGTADLTVNATAPAMTPRPDTSWQSIAVNLHVQGPFTRPEMKGTVRVDQLSVAGGGVGTVAANLAGDAGQVTLHAELDTVRVPSKSPDLFAQAPVLLDASAQLDTPDRPVHFTVRHPLMTAEGSLQTAGALQGTMSLNLPDLAPFAQAGGTDLHGNLAINLGAAVQGDTTQLTADGTLGVQSGPGPSSALLGDAAHFSVAAAVQNSDIALSRLQIDGKGISFSANGKVALPSVDLAWTMAVGDLSAVEPTLAGALQLRGHIGGAQDNLNTTIDLAGEVTTKGISSGPLQAHLEAQGLPNEPVAKLTADGSLLGAPLQLSLSAERRNETTHVTIDRGDWKSAHLAGDLSLLPPANLPQGRLELSMQHLDDLTPLLGRRISGSTTATLTAANNQAHVVLDVHGAELAGTAAASSINLDANVADLTGKPTIDGRLSVAGVAAAGVTGAAKLEANGPLDALALNLAATSPRVSGSPAQIATRATVNVTDRAVAIASLQANWHQQNIRLLAPVRIVAGPEIAVDNLRIGIGNALLEASGRVGKTLDVTASLRNLSAGLAGMFAPSMAADGTIQADARLTGTPEHPSGTIHVAATGLHLKTGPGRALPVASLNATANLAGTEARVDAHAQAGSSRLAVTGTAPLNATGAIDLRTTGHVDIAMLNPLLAADGRRVKGAMNVDAAIAGSAAAPRISGGAQLSGGEVQDFVLGIHLVNMAAQLQGNGDTLRLVQFSGQAGEGNVQASGSLDLRAPGMPLNLSLIAHNAKLLASNQITSVIEADLKVQGPIMTGPVAISGTARVDHADIQVPEKLPSSIATIPVRLAGSAPPPPPAAPRAIMLNLTLDAPGQIFVRGRGLDAELGGHMRLTGSLAKPQPEGGFNLRRGTLSVAGHTLTFTEGQVSFNGAGLTDPSLHLVATSTNGSVVATLTINGTVRDPKIVLSSVPDLPQDEILAQLLFQQGIGKLGPFQVAEIAAALASLEGAPSSVTDPLAKVRASLGLDVLSLGGSGGTSGSPTLEAGRYIAPRVYVGAKQNTSGGGTQATVQVDITKGLKLQATAGTGGGNATGAAADSSGDSVGVTYQFEY